MMLLHDFSNFEKIVKKIVLCRGEQLRKPTVGSVCCVFLENVNATTDSSPYFNHSTATITIGNSYSLVDRTIEYCIQTMSLQEQSRFTVDKTDNKMQFTATLKECYFKPYIFQMPDAEKLSLANNFKKQGTELFKENKICEAFEKYNRALQYVLTMNIHYPIAESDDQYPLSQEGIESSMELLMNLYNNIAFCHLTCKNFDHVITVCTRSIAVEPNVKAYYRRALAFIKNACYTKAEDDLLKALEIEHTNKEILEKLELVRKLDKPNEESYKKTVQKMFAA